ncbi:MAG: cyclic nucleotide-binding domain-containing protein, partial [Parvularculaceae bacterium]
MQPVINRLCELEFFRSLDSATLKAIIERGQWFSLVGGKALFAQGESSDAIYFVLSGRLIVVRQGPDGEEEVVAYVRAGEPVGEMALLSDEAHSASVFALRDTEILALPHAEFDALFEQHADLAGRLARDVLIRARHPRTSFGQASPRVFAFIASSPSIDIDTHVRRIAARAARYGLKVHFMAEKESAPESSTFENIECEHDILVLSARISDSSWYKFVLRHADRFFVFARRDARPSKPFPLAPSRESPARKFRLVDLVMLHEGAPAGVVAEWADAVDANRIFHLRDEACLDRLARAVAGTSIGLVLSGGGARAYAHIGAVKALREAGAPIDFICGASMGGIIAACVAMG